MKTGIHPDHVLSTVRCSCGNEFVTRSTKPELHVEVCSNCHPFYTGKQKLMDSGGRVERFQRRRSATLSTSCSISEMRPSGRRTATAQLDGPRIITPSRTA